MTTNELVICLPPIWPRPPLPPVPEPDPDSLDERVDWMTYSHPELYSMVHSGIDLSGAMAVSAKWARLGDELADIGEELSKLLTTTGQAWEGEAAELAKGSVSALAEWSRQTGTLATEVSGCVTIEVDNAANARNAMPPPPYHFPLPDPNPPLMPAPMPRPVPMPSQASAFTTGDFSTAAPLVADSMTYSSRERALHQQAARTMSEFQSNSRDVYATVPQFAPPDLRSMPYHPPEQPPQPPPTQKPQPNPNPTPGPGGYVGGPGSGGPGTGGGPGRAAGPGTPLGAGPSTGAAPGEQLGVRPAAAATGRGGGPGHAPMAGGMPMGAGAGQSGAEDGQRKGNQYLKEEDEDLWGMDDQRLVPPVIGEANRRA